MALTRADLDKMGCSNPDCTHDHGGPLFFHAACHLHAPVEVMYLDGELRVICGSCGRDVAIVAVAP